MSEPRENQPVCLEQTSKFMNAIYHLGELIDAVQWMSGASDFGPDGNAHEGWIKTRAKLKEAMKFYASQTMDGTQTIVMVDEAQAANDWDTSHAGE